MVRKALLKSSKVTIPFAALSVASATLAADKVSAAEAAETSSLFGPGIITKMITDPKGAIEGGKNTVEDIQGFIDWIKNAIEWCKNIPEHVAVFSVNLLNNVYELLMLVLQTPLFIFNNTYIKDASLAFAGISVLIVTILTMIEGNKQMLKMKHTDFKKICKRYFIAIIGAGAAPILFEKTFEVINMITSSITKIGMFGAKKETITENLYPGWFDWFNTFALLGFDVMVLALCIPILLQNGRRFFDLMCLAAITPLALTAWVFDDTRHMFNKWWYNLKHLGTTPLVYAIFISLLGLFIFGTQNQVSGGGLLIKMIIVIGGLYRMANPPSFVKQKVDNGDDIEGSLLNVYQSIKDTIDTITLKRSKTTKLIKKAVDDKRNEKDKLMELRRKHGKRSVQDLMINPKKK